MSSIDAQLVLRDQYDIKYGIYDHSMPGAEHPFQLMLHNWVEDTFRDGELHERFQRYLDHDVYKYTGMSFEQFIEQPTHVCLMMFEGIQRKIAKQAPEVKKALDALGGDKQTSP